MKTDCLDRAMYICNTSWLDSSGVLREDVQKLRRIAGLSRGDQVGRCSLAVKH